MTGSERPQGFLIFSGYNLRAVVALCRSLHRQHRPFRIVACTKDDPIFLTRWSRQVAATRQMRGLDADDLLRCVRECSAAAGFNRWAIAPSSEFFVRWCLAQRELLASAGCTLPLPDADIYRRISDKRPFVDFARERGLEVPRESADADAIGLPCVAKPMANITADGRSLYPWLLRTADDLARFRAATKPGEFFFQEWVDGESIYLLLHLARDGRASRFSQRNLAQQPGGKSIVLAESARFHDSPVAEKWEAALRQLNFHGIIMIEFRVDSSGRAVMIEANPRMWGPLQFIVDSAPGLLAAYCDDVLGPAARTSASEHPKARGYLWYGGAASTPRQARGLTWLVPTPANPGWMLLRRLGDDVYLRADTWRLFLSEVINGRAAEVPGS
jgi:predicted ATP-grasp superfamily ATP-dependent carboligase